MKKWKIFLIQHSHVDIGYTERQEKIEQYQVDFIRQAVDYALIEKKDEGAPFKFTCESFWAVEKYLEAYGKEGEKRFLQAVETGRLELTAFYLHNAELLTRSNLVGSLNRASAYAKKNSLVLNTALSCDVNGFPWAMADMLADKGVSYLMTCINTHHGGAPFGKPLIPFYWTGPEGKKVLVWNGLTYHKANLLGLIPGPNPMGDAGIPGMKSDKDGTEVVSDICQAEVRVKAMVDGLDSIGYPYDFLPIMGSGLYTDNSPVTKDYLELVDQWNEKHGHEIEIITSTVEEFFKYLEATVEDIPTYSGDWNDWWTDGTISTPMEVKTFRHAQRIKDMLVNLNKNGCITDKEIRDIEEKLYLFSEHTWGHSASESQPWDFLVNQVEFRKSMHAYNADQMASKALDKVLRQWGEGEFRVDRPHEYSVINPLRSKKKDVFLLPVDFWEVAMVGEDFLVVDEENQTYDYQITQTLRGTNVCVVSDVEPLSDKKFKILYGQKDRIKRNEKVDLYKRQYSVKDGQQYENTFYKVIWNDKGICSLVSKDVRTELLKQTEDQKLCLPVYQVFMNGDRGDAAGFGYGSRKKPEDTVFKGALDAVEIMESGPVFVRLKLAYTVEGAHDYNVYVTFYHELPIIDFNIHVTKTIERDPEGLYVQFPFDLKDGKWEIEKQGIFIKPGVDQLPGTCCDYYSVSHGARMTNGSFGIGLSLLDAPLMMINGLNLWNFSTEINPTGTMYSWLTNNKWETNFKVQCGGMYDFRYRLEFGSGLADAEQAYETVYRNSYELLAVRS